MARSQSTGDSNWYRAVSVGCGVMGLVSLYVGVLAAALAGVARPVPQALLLLGGSAAAVATTVGAWRHRSPALAAGAVGVVGLVAAPLSGWLCLLSGGGGVRLTLVGDGRAGPALSLAVGNCAAQAPLVVLLGGWVGIAATLWWVSGRVLSGRRPRPDAG